MSDSENLFVHLQPPAGGLQRLQENLGNRPRRKPSVPWSPVAGTVAVAMLVLVWLVPGMLARHRQTTMLIDAMRSDVAPLDGQLHVANGAAVELPSGQSNMRLFLVQTTSTTESATQAKPTP